MTNKSDRILSIVIVIVIISLTLQISTVNASHNSECKRPFTMLYSFTPNPKGFCTLLENSHHQPVNSSTGLPFK